MSEFEHTNRGGVYYRVADPSWNDPLDGSLGVPSGGRWIRPGTNPVVYLNQTVALAKRFVAHKLRGQPYGPEDLDPGAGPDLVVAAVPDDSYVDIVSDRGCMAAGLPESYPFSLGGERITQEQCWPIGAQAWDLGEPGIACRSATTGAARSDEELAWFQRDRALALLERSPFASWFF